MNQLISKEEQFMDGKCVFCGEEGEQKSYPGGSFGRYLYCDCLESVTYYEKYDKYTRELWELSTCARARKDLIDLEKEDRELNREIDRINEKKCDILWEAKRRMKAIEGENANENNIRRKRRN